MRVPAGLREQLQSAPLLGIQLHGRLGNQMFMYAAATTLAERLDCRLLITGRKARKEPGLLKHWFRTRRPPEAEWADLGVLNRAFGFGPGIVLGRIAEMNIARLRRSVLPRTFAPRTILIDGTEVETLDAAFHAQRPGTWLQGYYQSEYYFEGRHAQIREMFAPSPRHLTVMNRIIADWPAPPEQMAAIHVRRGDYGRIQGALSDPVNGLQLPSRYYFDALDRIPAATPLAVFSDDPDWAARLFSDRNAWVSRGNLPVIDMLLMAQCRWVVTANSSFSWWGGWLNDRPDRVVFAPLHHLGWRIGRWVPEGVCVEGWTYVTVKPD